MGENKASYLAKSTLDKLPEADQDVGSSVHALVYINANHVK